MDVKKIDKDLDWLRKVSSKVSFDDKELLSDIEVVRNYSLNHGVFAMAAIQLGIVFYRRCCPS